MNWHNPLSVEKYLVSVGITALLVSLPFTFNVVFLYQAAEMMPFARVVDEQRRDRALYGPAFLASSWTYKLALARRVQPEVVLLGSSRVGLLREEAFKAPFLNAGVSMHSLKEGQMFTAELIRIHTPKVLLLGIDPCWFNAAHPEPDGFPEHVYKPEELTRYKLLSPFVWLLQRKMSIRDYVNILLGRCVNFATDYPNLGLLALLTNSGSRKDGSLLYGSQVAGNSPLVDAKFNKSLDMLGHYRDQYVEGTRVDPERWSVFLRWIGQLRAHGSNVIVFIPPFAAPIAQRIRSSGDHFGYIEDLNERLRSGSRTATIEYYDFRELSSIGSNSCECLSGDHPGEISWFRLVRQMTKDNPQSAIVPYLNAGKLDAMINAFQGRVLYPGEQREIRFKEVDFLQIGCIKN